MYNKYEATFWYLVDGCLTLICSLQFFFLFLKDKSNHSSAEPK